MVPHIFSLVGSLIISNLVSLSLRQARSKVFYAIGTTAQVLRGNLQALRVGNIGISRAPLLSSVDAGSFTYYQEVPEEADDV